MFYYLDSGLCSNLGHSANSARAILGELRKRDMPVKAYCHDGMDAALSHELQVEPYFRWNTYQKTDGDPISGWLGGFLAGAESMCNDIHSITIRHEFEDGDIIYVNSAQAAEFYGVVQWLNIESVHHRPHVILEFGVSPGLDVMPDGNLATRDPRADPQACFLRYAATQMAPHILPHISLVTYDKTASEAFSKLLDRPVHTLPTPREAVHIRHRGKHRRVPGKEHRPITVGFIGHLRGETGVHLLPDIVHKLLAESDVSVLAWAGDPNAGGHYWQELKAMEASGRVYCGEGHADATQWGKLLDDIDLMVLAYDPNRFRFSYSSVACEAIANGIPLAVPKGTTMERLAVDFDTGYFCTIGWEAKTIASDIMHAAGYSFEGFANASFAAAKKWAATQGPAKTVDAMLALAGAGETSMLPSFV
jgi:glycosyltransferase involved in cell wall biosynthesis